MKRLLVAALALLAPSLAQAQTTFANQPNVLQPISSGDFALVSQNVNGKQVTGKTTVGAMWGGIALTGDCTIVSLAITCLKSNGVAFGALATASSVPASYLPALTGDVSSTAGTAATTIAAGAVSAAKMASGAAAANLGYTPANKAGETFTGAVNVAAGLSYRINGTNVLGPSSLATAMMPALTGDVTTSAGTVATSIAAGSVSAAKMASGAAVGNIGYTPANKAGDTFGGAVTIPTLTVSGCTGYLYGNAASAATCSTSIPFTQLGTGAVARTVDSKLKNGVFSVLDYGAACDGATNDTAAIRLAITAIQANGGGFLDFPYKGGLCQVNTASGGPLTLSGDVAVTLRGIGDGGIKNNATDGSNTIYIGGAGPGTHQALVKVQDLKVWGSTTNGSGVYGSYATNLQVIGSSFYQNGQMGVFGDNSYSIVIDHNTMSANGVAGVYLQNAGGNASRITHNIISGHTGTNHAGIAFGGTTNYNIQIMNNSIELNYWGIHGDNVDGLTIIGNYMENNAGSNTEINLTSATVKGVTLVGNTLFGYAGINSADGVTVVGNTFLGATSVLDGTSSTNTFVSGNNFPNAGTVANFAITALSAKTTVASLPTCNAGAEGSLYSVTNANSTTFNAALAGGGTNHVMAYCNGTGWTVH